MARQIGNPVRVPLDARRRFRDLVIAQREFSWLHDPRLCENFRIERRRLILDDAAVAMETFDYPQVSSMKRSIIDKPAVLVEILRFNDEGVSFPMTDGVSEIAGFNIRPIGSSISGNDPEEIPREIVIQEHDFTRRLKDPRWRTDAGNTRRHAAERGILKNLTGIEILHLRLELRSVLGTLGRRCPTTIPTEATDWRGLIRTVEYAHRLAVGPRRQRPDGA